MNEVIGNKMKSEILAEKFATLGYGEVILHTEISKIIQEPYPSPKYSDTVGKARKILQRETGKVVECIRGDGYRMVEPGGYVDQSLKHYKKGFNEIQKGTDTLSKAPTKDMTPEELNTYRKVNDRAVILQASMKGAVVELKTLGEKKHPFALENMNR